MKKLKIIIVLMIGVLSLSSCDEFLDVEPTNSANSSTSITNELEAQVAMNGLMRRMIDANNYGRNVVLYADAKGGDLAIRRGGRGNDALYLFTHTQQTSNYSGYWSDFYVSILQTNNIIVNIEKMEEEGISSVNLSHIKGQALTARALMYFNLVRIYGKPYVQDKSAYGVPIVLDIADASLQPLRATVEEVYTQIIADLKAAESILLTAKEVGYINKYANLAIQARVYQTMGNQAAALTAAEAIITSEAYTLYSNANWVAAWSAQGASESIFELSIDVNEGQLGTGSLGHYYLPANTAGALGMFMASKFFLERLGEDPDDVRWGVMMEDESSEPGAIRRGSSNKYAGGPAMMGDKGASASAANVKVIRLSEVYLIAAEAALGTDKGKAANYLNEIRKRSPNLPLATESTVTLEMIIDEKSKELFLEGNRYWDLLRLGWDIEFDDDFNLTQSTPLRQVIMNPWTEFRAILPVPQNEIDANPGIEAQQNPGYGSD